MIVLQILANEIIYCYAFEEFSIQELCSLWIHKSVYNNILVNLILARLIIDIYQWQSHTCVQVLAETHSSIF